MYRIRYFKPPPQKKWVSQKREFAVLRVKLTFCRWNSATKFLCDRHFIIRSLYKNLYWCDLTHQTKLQCWHCYIHAELLLYFILARPICIVLYTFMNFVHSCVWQLLLKNKRWDETFKQSAICSWCPHRVSQRCNCVHDFANNAAR